MAKGKGGFIGQDGLNAPDAPTGVSGTAGDTQVDVSFTSPSDVGGSAITGYRVTDSTGAFGASGSASPITVTGLTNGTSYTFNVWAINAFGWSSPSDASDAVSPAQPRALFAGGMVYPADTRTNIIDYVAISTLGNASDFGDLAAATDAVAGAANATRGLFAGGYVGSIQNTIQYVTIASTGNTQDFGDLTVSRYYFTSGTNTTRAIWFGGNDSGYSNTIDYVTIATAGNAADFGDMTNFIQAQQNGTCSSPTRSLSAGGFQFSKSPPQINRIDYVTTATLGNATDFGDLLEETAQGGACASSTRGLFSGGNNSSGSLINTIQYVTLASTGNASDFGDLHTTIEKTTSASSETRGLVSAGGDSTASSGGNLNNINYVTIATTGNSSDFGDLTFQFDNHSGLSNAHGGLQ